LNIFDTIFSLQSRVWSIEVLNLTLLSSVDRNVNCQNHVNERKRFIRTFVRLWWCRH